MIARCYFPQSDSSSTLKLIPITFLLECGIGVINFTCLKLRPGSLPQTYILPHFSTGNPFLPLTQNLFSFIFSLPFFLLFFHSLPPSHDTFNQNQLLPLTNMTTFHKLHYYLCGWSPAFYLLDYQSCWLPTKVSFYSCPLLSILSTSSSNPVKHKQVHVISLTIHYLPISFRLKADILIVIHAGLQEWLVSLTWSHLL